MEEIRKFVSGFLNTVPGLVGIILSDREGVLLVKSSLPECPEGALKPSFLTNYTSCGLAEQVD